ncbi:IS5 family transposase [Candidatus Woesearchaeota archaeon]|nr:IS5 family transposase [Candidatus Woesearchaeota archaeon]
MRLSGAPKWFHHFGPKKFLLSDLVLGLAVMSLYRLSYRRASIFLDEYYELRVHWTTLQKAAKRLPLSLWQAVLVSTAPDESIAGAIDASGFSMSNPSYHYLRRIDGKLPKCSLKTSILIDIDSRRILSARVRMKARHDTRDVAGLLLQAKAKPWSIVMDKGYDSEKIHSFLDEKGVWSIAPTRKNARRGKHRRALKTSFPEEEYAHRNLVENAFMRLKTLFGGYVRSRKARNVRAEMFMKFIMYNMMSLLSRHFLQHRKKERL